MEELILNETISEEKENVLKKIKENWKIDLKKLIIGGKGGGETNNNFFFLFKLQPVKQNDICPPTHTPQTLSGKIHSTN